MTLSVFITVTHLLGAGHLTRAAAIGRALASADHRVTLVTGGMPTSLIATIGLEVVQLPPVRALNEDFRSLAGPTGQTVDEHYLAARRAHLLTAFATTRPDILLTELYPFGRRILATEHQALLEAAWAMRPRPLVVCSLRDILVAPVKQERLEETHRLVESRYDAVLVHGDPGLAPLEASWPLPERLRSRVTYTGYVDAEPSDAGGAYGGASDILVSGGSSEAALPLYRAALGAAARMTDRHWHLLVGRSVQEPDVSDLVSAAGANVTVERARPDFRALMARSSVFVGLAGYNTVVDLLAAGPRAVLVPFERGRETEQRLRADRLAACGLAQVLPEQDLSAGTLVAAIEAALAAPRPLAAAIDRDGGAKTASILAEMTAARPGPAPGIVRLRLSAGFRQTLRRDLDSWADAGRIIELWWRDDDATAQTPALDRLLDLASALGIPVAIAAVPAFVEPSLRDRLAGDAGVRVLVHGWRHDNHAPAGSKAAEFGGTRAVAEACGEITRAWRAIEAAFGGQAVPVFVPPWNRISPEIVAALPECGFCGVSCFGTSPRRTHELRRVDTHVDPVDWRGTRSLLGEDAMRCVWQRTVSADEMAGDRAVSVGFLSHHLASDDEVWAFTEEWLTEVADHPAVRIADLAKLWPSASTPLWPTAGEAGGT